MKRVEGYAGVKLMECVSPVKNKWRIRWDVQEKEDGTATYMEEEFAHKPDTSEIKNVVMGWFNEQIDNAILSSFKWNGMEVWLSSENQFNYKAAYDLAVQKKGNSLPVTFKFGTDEEPCYHEFRELDELDDFYTKAMQHIQSTLSDGWKKKGLFNLDLYKAE